jgi:polycystin 1
MASPAATHFYVLPGSYHMTVVLALGAGSALLETEVQVEATPTVLELVCPSFVHSNESLELGIRHRGGSALEVTYSILALDKEPAQGAYPPASSCNLGGRAEPGTQPHAYPDVLFIAYHT